MENFKTCEENKCFTEKVFFPLFQAFQSNLRSETMISYCMMEKKNWVRSFCKQKENAEDILIYIWSLNSRWLAYGRFLLHFFVQFYFLNTCRIDRNNHVRIIKHIQIQSNKKLSMFFLFFLLCVRCIFNLIF